MQDNKSIQTNPKPIAVDFDLSLSLSPFNDYIVIVVVKSLLWFKLRVCIKQSSHLYSKHTVILCLDATLILSVIIYQINNNYYSIHVHWLLIPSFLFTSSRASFFLHLQSHLNNNNNQHNTPQPTLYCQLLPSLKKMSPPTHTLLHPLPCKATGQGEVVR